MSNAKVQGFQSRHKPKDALIIYGVPYKQPFWDCAIYTPKQLYCLVCSRMSLLKSAHVALLGQYVHTHSDTGFQLMQVTLGRKVREQKGAWVRALERFNIVVTKAAAIKSAAQLLGTNRFVGSIMETP